MFPTSEERTKFGEWLKQEADSDAEIIKQMELLPLTRVTSALAKQRTVEMMAKRIVARVLLSTLSESL